MAELDIFNPQVSTVAKSLEGKVIIVYGGNNLGKAQPINTVVPTPLGEKKLEDLNVGDYVFDRFGRPTEILSIHEQGLLDNYKVTLRDGRSTYCNDEHIWGYYTSRNLIETKTLKEMVSIGIRKGGGYRFHIPTNKAVEYNEKKYSVDPYVLGAFIGDGCTTSSGLTISSNDEEVVAEIALLIGCPEYKKNSSKNYNWTFRKKESEHKPGIVNFQTKEVFKDYPEIVCLAGNKRIPRVFLYGSIEQRYALLQGLMDTDGHIGDGKCSYSTTSFGLAEDIVYLLNSLGMSGTIHEDVREDKNTCYYICISASEYNKVKMFRLAKKKNLAEAFKYNGNHRKGYYRHYNSEAIVAVEKMNEKVEMRCIEVDNEDHLYLTNDFIVTHNTKQATRMKKPFYLPFEQGLNAIQGVPFAPINSWSDFIKINKQLTSPSTVEKARELYSTIIFDEIDAAANYCQAFICQKYGVTSIAEGRQGFGLWSEYEKAFWSEINRLIGAGYCCYFIAHAQEKDGFISPKADKRALAPIMNNADICVYVRTNGVSEEGKVIKSSGFLAESDTYFARSRFDYLPSTYMPEFTAEALEEIIVKAIENQEKVEGVKAVTFNEQKAQRTVKKKPYSELMETMQNLGEKIAEGGFLNDLQVIVEGHLGTGNKASDLDSTQLQLIEAIIYDLEELIVEKGL